MHEWMIDNDLTPHIVVDAEHDGVDMPVEHVNDGKIVLNISYAATRRLELGNADISFEARFAGVERKLCIPITAVLGIYSRETGQGMVFSDEEPEPPPAAGSSDSGKPNLKVVK